MRLVFVRAALASVALLLPFGLVGPGNAVPVGPAMADPDIKIVFYGLMVFDAPANGTQVIRLHSGADGHQVHIQINGPGYDRPYEWASAYPKNSSLNFAVATETGISPDRARFPDQMPYNMRGLHGHSDTLGDLVMDDNAFGPILTLHAGDFAQLDPEKDVVFMNSVKTTNPVSVTKSVQASIDLQSGEIGVYLSGNVPGGDPLPMVFLRKPPAGTRKWKIEVSVQPDFAHICGYHFTHYYDGFRFKKTPQAPPIEIPPWLKYRATKGGDSPCDSQVNIITAIETRPCIPISF